MRKRVVSKPGFLKWGIRRLGKMTSFTALRKRGGSTVTIVQL